MGTIENDEEWEFARKIWARGGVNLPKKMSKKNAHRLTDLKRGAATFGAAQSVTEIDRERNWSTDQLADQCRDLHDGDAAEVEKQAGFTRLE